VSAREFGFTHSLWVLHTSSNKIEPNSSTLLGSLSDHGANGLRFDLWYVCLFLFSSYLKSMNCQIKIKVFWNVAWLTEKS